MTIRLNQILQSLQMFSNTEASFKELDIFPSLRWSRDGVVISKYMTSSIHIYYGLTGQGKSLTQTCVIHLVVKTPII